MTSSKKHEPGTGDGAKSGKAKDPEWANGLKQLYDSVVNEPLPDSFKSLLDQFDDEPRKPDAKSAERSSGEGSSS